MATQSKRHRNYVQRTTGSTSPLSAADRLGRVVVCAQYQHPWQREDTDKGVWRERHQDQGQSQVSVLCVQHPLTVVVMVRVKAGASRIKVMSVSKATSRARVSKENANKSWSRLTWCDQIHSASLRCAAFSCCLSAYITRACFYNCLACVVCVLRDVCGCGRRK